MMSTSSDGEYTDMDIEIDGIWERVKRKRKRKRDPNSPTEENPRKLIQTQQEIQRVIFGSPTNAQQTKNNQQEKQSTSSTKNSHSKNTNNPSNKQIEYTLQDKNTVPFSKFHNKQNFSAKMKEISNKSYKYLFHIKTKENLTRKALSDIWDREHSETDDIILSTRSGFLLKTNQEKDNIIKTLNKLISSKEIENYFETQPLEKSSASNTNFNVSYSVVIGSVELEISDSEVSEFLSKGNIEHRYCKRIISRSTGKPTLMIRMITSCLQSSEKLLSEGIFYKHRYYPVYPSNPPTPIPQPCSRCQLFTHTRDNCTTPLRCTKCNGPHHYSKCNTQLPPKCAGCGAEDHAAWSLKCPKRPTKPIEGIPNNQIKSLNKKSAGIDPNMTRNSKIHSPVTIHDMIIDTYINKLNKENNSNREELITKLRKRFINQYYIDTVAHFSGNRLYILMFDLDQPMTTSPTQPISGPNNVQIHIET